jgi:hypothetical protein
MNRLLLILLVSFLTFSARAQYNWEYGLLVGGANYLGDIGGQEQTRRDFVWDMHLHKTNIALGAYGRYKLSKRMAILANLSYMQLNTADSESLNPARVARNLNFRNRMFELGGRAEVTIFYDNDVGGKGYYNPDFRFYVFGGVSVFAHNPQAQVRNPESEFFGDTWHNLRPMRTEGQNEEYGLLGLAIPAGMGLYFTFDKTWRVGWELSWRTTFTDYLDDVSSTYADPATLPSDLARALASQTNQAVIDAINDPSSGSVEAHQYVEGFSTKRGDPTNNDSFLTTQFSIGKVIRGRSQFYRKKYSWLRNRTGARKSRAKF